MDDVLDKLFGSAARAKMLRLFLSNQEACMTLDEVATHTKVAKTSARKEISSFSKMGLIKPQSCVREVSVGRGKKAKEVRKRFPGFIVDQDFKHLFALRNFILNIAPTDNKGILKRVSNAGKLKLVVTSGVFIQDTDSRVDIMVVGDSVNDARLKAAVRELESHMGRELRYATFSTKDFIYRLGVYDRLLRDILDYPHQVVLDKLGPGWKDIHMRKRSNAHDEE